MLFQKSQEVIDKSVQHYKIILRNIFEQTPVVSQTARSPDGVICTSLTSNYLCLQCSTIVQEEDRLKHGNKKNHRFCMLLLPATTSWLVPPADTTAQSSSPGTVTSIVRYAMT